MIDATEKKWILVDSETKERIGKKVFTNLDEAETTAQQVLNESKDKSSKVLVQELLMG